MEKLPSTTQSVDLSRIDSQIIEARQSKKIIKATDAEIKGAIAYVMVLLGENAQTIDSFGKSVGVTVLIKSLRRAFPHMKVDEIKIAFEFASDKKFEVNLSLYNRMFNSEYVAKVITEYQEYRKPTIKKEQLLIDAPKAEPTIEEKKKIVMKGIQESFENYKETGKMPDVCAWMYQELENSGTLVHSNELKSKIYKDAQVELKKRLKDKQSSVDGFSIKEIAKRLQNIEEDGEVKTIARELALKHYWDKQIQEL